VRLNRIAIGALVVALAAFLVNAWGGIDQRCSDQGWSGCGTSYQLSGWITLAGLVVLLTTVLIGAWSWLRRRRV
jgi:hypothetical protein